MTYNAKTIAEWILYLAAQKGLRLSNMQLQKNLYYAQGYYLGMTGEKLFEDVIEAWEHGPVVPSIYHQFKLYAGNKITPPENIEIPEDMQGFIDIIVSEKSKMSAADIRKATHSEPPYINTQWNHEITADKLIAFFSGLFWTSDEEDEFEPSFETAEESRQFFKLSFSDEKKRAIFNACAV